MNVKRILGIVLLLAGIACILFAKYINNQITEGQAKVDKAQQQVDQSNSLFSLNPVTKEVGKGLTNPIQQKINAGQATIEQYEALALWLNVGGIVLIVLGVIVFLLGFAGKR